MSTPFESFGKYILLEKLATGGMAEVFLARGSGAGGIGKFFAIKRILPQYADSPEFIDMFKDEAKIAINLNHSNIVSIHEFGVEKGQFFLVMDYVEGRNLRQILNKMKKSSLQFSFEQIVYIIKEVAAGLDHAHRCLDGTTGKPLNITHRDMSPQNVMISFEGEVKIVDFGIAKAESQLETTRAGTLKGKFGYMSPEQAEGLPVDLRTDIFSLGIVTWELLANDRLFVANNEINTLRKIRDCQIPSLRKVNPNINSELERIAQKALARDRNLRYQTGAALQRDLNRFLNRQYPDFSTQDFAVFIKSVFADEILSLRKRLVEYTKLNPAQATVSSPSVNFGVGNSGSFNGRNSSLLDPNTSSLIIATTNVNSTSPEAKTVAAPPLDTKSQANALNTNAGFNTQDQSMPSLELSTPHTHTASPGRSPANTLPPVRQELTGPILNSDAIEAEMKRELAIPSNTDYTDVSSPSIRRRQIRRNNRMDENNYYATRSSSSAKPMRFATFMVFALVCVSVYSYLVKYFTPMMSEVIVATDPYLHELHVALDVDYHLVNPALQGSTTTASSSPTPPQTAAPGTATTPQPAGKTDEEALSTSVVVISNPSGAEVLINEKSTGLVTPTRVEVPKENFDITIRKRGFMDTKMRDVTRAKLGHRIVANLVKMNVAYLDIDILPPQDVLIYVNGKLINSRGPIRDLPVLANTPLKIRAETRSLTTYDEVTVSIPIDKKQAVQLNPHRPLRIPSNAPEQ